MNPFEHVEIANNYDKFYETPFGKQVDQLEKKAVRKILSKIPPCLMLELGCGTGHWTSFFAEQGFKVIALDSSRAMLDIAIKKNIPNTSFIEANAVHIPFCFDSFLFTAAITMLEFISEPINALHEMYRVTKHKGHVLLGCLNPDSLLFKVKDEKSIFRYAHFYTKSEILQMTSFMGYIETVETVYVDESFHVYPFLPNYEPAFIVYHIIIEKNR